MPRYPDLYTAAEAREKLGGIAPESLKRLVEDGKIRRIIPPENKKRGYYHKEDVDKLARAMQHFMDVYSFTEDEGKPEFVRAQSEEDIKATIRIDKQYFGDQIHSPEKRFYWFKICPNGDYILKHHNIIVGYFSMQGIKQESVDRLFFHKKSLSTTQPEEMASTPSVRPIQTYVAMEDMTPMLPGKPIQTYVSMIAVKADEAQSRAKIYGTVLLMNLEKVFLDLANEGIEIRTIWAKSGTVPGIKLCRDFGFTELGYINNDQIGFKLDIETSNLPMVQKYRQAFAEYKKSQNRGLFAHDPFSERK